MVLGSGDSNRYYGGVGPALGNHFARSGIVCLIWDRPGVGGSTGDYNAQTFLDRAGEALAAVRFLRKRSVVRPDRVGLWGHSQGGMVAPLAASLSDEVAFLIEVSGWQGPAWQQDLVRVELEVRAAGFSDADVRRAVALARERMDLIRGSGPYEELAKLQSAAKAERWFRHVGHCDRALFESARKNVGYDTAPSWEGVRCPVLVIYGDRDTSSGPPEPLIAVIRRGLEKVGNKDVTVKVFRSADHSLRVSSGEWSDSQSKSRLSFAPGYLELMTEWILGKARASESGGDDGLRHPR
jgi:pimeloyl-ACP methyl ester carboxylesterase